jgi:hypothetical protein
MYFISPTQACKTHIPDQPTARQGVDSKGLVRPKPRSYILNKLLTLMRWFLIVLYNFEGVFPVAHLSHLRNGGGGLALFENVRPGVAMWRTPHMQLSCVGPVWCLISAHESCIGPSCCGCVRRSVTRVHGSARWPRLEFTPYPFIGEESLR